MNMEWLNHVLQIGAYLSFIAASGIWLYLFRTNLKLYVDMAERVEVLSYRVKLLEDKKHGKS